MLIFGHELMTSVEQVKNSIATEYKEILLACYGGPCSFAETIDSQLQDHSKECPPKKVREGVKANDFWGFVYTRFFFFFFFFFFLLINFLKFINT